MAPDTYATAEGPVEAVRWDAILPTYELIADWLLPGICWAQSRFGGDDRLTVNPLMTRGVGGRATVAAGDVVKAAPGDWIVKLQDGRVRAMSDAHFAAFRT